MSWINEKIDLKNNKNVRKTLNHLIILIIY